MNEDKSSRYHRLKRRGDVLERLWGVLLLGGLLATGLSRGLRDWVSLAANESAALSVALYAGSLLLLHEAGRASARVPGRLPRRATVWPLG